MATKYDSTQLFTIPRSIRVKNGINTESISTMKTLTYADSQVQLLSPSGGTKTVKLPALKSGMYFHIFNTSASQTMHVHTPTGVNLYTLAANAGSAAACGIHCFCDGVKWYGVEITCRIAFSA